MKRRAAHQWPRRRNARGRGASLPQQDARAASATEKVPAEGSMGGRTASVLPSGDSPLSRPFPEGYMSIWTYVPLVGISHTNAHRRGSTVSCVAIESFVLSRGRSNADEHVRSNRPSRSCEKMPPPATSNDARSVSPGRYRYGRRATLGDVKLAAPVHRLTVRQCARLARRRVLHRRASMTPLDPLPPLELLPPLEPILPLTPLSPLHTSPHRLHCLP